MMADWTHPAISPDWTNPSTDNLASAIHDYDDMAEEARAALARRRSSYPDLIKSGRLTADDARADLIAWQAIARDWRWIAYGDGEPSGIDTLPARADALDTAITRWLGLVHQNGGSMSLADRRQGKLLAALRWWAQRELSDAAHIRISAAIGHDWRRQNGFPTRGAMLAARAFCPACERRAEDSATNACTRTDCGKARTAKRAGSHPNDERKAA